MHFARVLLECPVPTTPGEATHRTVGPFGARAETRTLLRSPHPFDPPPPCPRRRHARRRRIHPPAPLPACPERRPHPSAPGTRAPAGATALCPELTGAGVETPVLYTRRRAWGRTPASLELQSSLRRLSFCDGEAGRVDWLAWPCRAKGLPAMPDPHRHSTAIAIARNEPSRGRSLLHTRPQKRY